MISLTVHVPGKEPQSITVNQASQVQVLEEFYPNIETAFILHKSNVILPRFSFQFLGIKDGDHVYIAEHHYSNISTHCKVGQKKKNQDKSLIYKFAKMQNMESIVPLDLVLEASRLKDLHLMRIESNGSNYRKLVHAYTSQANTQREPAKSVPLFSQQAITPNAPSTESILVSWN